MASGRIGIGGPAPPRRPRSSEAGWIKALFAVTVARPPSIVHRRASLQSISVSCADLHALLETNSMMILVQPVAVKCHGCPAKPGAEFIIKSGNWIFPNIDAIEDVMS
ncbi:hypothetical protein U9M48_010763 [Paspalum notatum var. saurae]|uniref:Uncharacterized protein n=1 Tax=Paspalum notatum var. saurae TaxID=547442 RepID=A0AAQ3STP7_PASNO